MFRDILMGFGRCDCPPGGASCPDGYSSEGGRSYCNKCERYPFAENTPGYQSVKNVGEGEGEVSMMVSLGECSQGDHCVDSTFYCVRDCDQHPFPEVFPTHCQLNRENYCAKSREVCNDKHWENFQIWADFLLNFIPGGGQTVKGAAKAAQKSKDFRQLNRALRRVARKAVKQMKDNFKKELKELRKDLMKAVGEEVKGVIDGVIDDILEEMSLKASQEDQEDSELGDIVLEALGDFVVDFFSPFDFRGMVALMDGPNCDEYSRISSTDLEWEDLHDGMENVAYRKKATQSSTYDEASADLAVDGNYDGDYHAGSVAHTNFHPNQWWEVDLEKLYTIERINVYNREDYGGSRLKGVRVEIFNGNTVEWTHTMSNDATPDYETSIKVPSTKGNRVRLSLPHKTEYLQLTEVEVIARPK